MSSILRHPAAALALAASISLGAAPAWGQPAAPAAGTPAPESPPPGAPAGAAAEAREREARALYERGVRHFHLAEYDAAIDAFKAAYRVSDAPGFLYNIALAARMKRDCAQALHFYRMYLRLAPTAPNRAEVEKRIPEVRRCALAAAPAASGPAPATRPLGAAASRHPATPTPRARPGDRREAVSPFNPPPPTARLKRILGLSLAGGGVLFLAAATMYGVKAHAAADTISGLFRDGGQWDSHYRLVEADGKRFANLALGFGVVGGAALAGGAALYYLGWRERRPALFITPTPRGAALVVSWAR